MQASVVICAMGRNRLLHWSIRSALAQTLAPNEYEVIVAEGDAKGQTIDPPADSEVWRVVSAEAGRARVKLRYLYVPCASPQKLLQAAHRAAQGDRVVSLPAHQVAHPEWLADTLYAREQTAGQRLAE